MSPSTPPEASLRARRVLVVGGGLTGLAAAYELAKKGAGCVLVEGSPRLGGKIVTEKVGGFLVEGGPDSFVSYKPSGIALCRELGLALIGTRPETKGAFILCRGRLVPIPDGASSLAPTKLWPFIRTGLLSWRGKLRAGLELIQPARAEGGDESLGDFMVRRFGTEFYERFAEPLLSGVYAGDARTLSLRSTFPRLAELERAHGSLIRGLRRRMPPSNGASVFMTPEGGLASLVSALEAKLGGVERVLGDPAESLSRVPSGWSLRLRSGRALEAPAVVVAAPAWAASGLLLQAAPEASALLSLIPFVPSATVAFGFERWTRPLPGHGFLIPACERRRLLACTWVSSKYQGRAPEGGALLRGYYGSRGGWEGLPDAALAREALSELKALMGFDEEPSFSRVSRWEKAMPQYQVGHEALLGRIEGALKGLGGLVLAGSSYRGVGLPDCVDSARRAAGCALAPAEGGVLA